MSVLNSHYSLLTPRPSWTTIMSTTSFNHICRCVWGQDRLRTQTHIHSLKNSILTLAHSRIHVIIEPADGHAHTIHNIFILFFFPLSFFSNGQSIEYFVSDFYHNVAVHNFLFHFMLVRHYCTKLYRHRLCKFWWWDGWLATVCQSFHSRDTRYARCGMPIPAFRWPQTALICKMAIEECVRNGSIGWLMRDARTHSHTLASVFTYTKKIRGTTDSVWMDRVRVFPNEAIWQKHPHTNARACTHTHTQSPAHMHRRMHTRAIDSNMPNHQIFNSNFFCFFFFWVQQLRAKIESEL